METSFLTFTPKMVKKKSARSKIISSKIVFESPRKRKQNALPLQDVYSSPSNFQNIEKNRKSKGKENTIVLNDSPFNQCGNKSRVKYFEGETIIVESSDTDDELHPQRQRPSEHHGLETIVISDSDPDFVDDSEPNISTLFGKDSERGSVKKSNQGDKEKEIGEWLDELQDFIYTKRRSYQMEKCQNSISESSAKDSTDYKTKELGNDSEAVQAVNKHPRVSGRRNNVQGGDQSNMKATVDTSGSSSKHFKETPKKQNIHLKRAVTQPEGSKKHLPNNLNNEKEMCKMDDNKFEDIVQWLGKVSTPTMSNVPTSSVSVMSEDSDDNSMIQVRRRVGKQRLIESDSESENCSSGSSGKKKKLQSLSDKSKTSSTSSVGKTVSTDSDKIDSSSSESWTRRIRQNRLNTGKIGESKKDSDKNVSKFFSWRKNFDQSSSEVSESSSSDKKSNENDASSDFSTVSATSVDRLLSNIYGNTWDKNAVLTPIIEKSKRTQTKRDKSQDKNERKEKSPLRRKEKEQTFPTPTPPTKGKSLDFKNDENLPTSFKTPKPKSLKVPKDPPRTPVQKINCTINFGFLRSLSGSPPISQCNPKALIYKKDFKNKKEALCAELFAYYNKVVFDSKLPADTKIDWNPRLNRTAGFCYNKTIPNSMGSPTRISRIELASKVCTSADRVRDTLIHELCHAAAWIFDGVKTGHGYEWKAWVRRALKKLPELPPIGRCHRYQIETKYTYRCKQCGYSIGRHSKSLDCVRKRCGYCYGEFELLVNSKGRNGGSAGTQRAPRNVTGFALYVKENYKVVKGEQKDLKHSEIMKLLGTKFATLKMQPN